MHLQLNPGFKIVLGLALLGIALSVPAASQAQSGPAPASSTQTSAQSVSLDFVVTDKAGKPVSGLSQSDFTLTDNGQPVKFSSFQATDLSGPTAVSSDSLPEIILVFDAVNVTVSDVANERLSVSKFLRQNGGHLAAPITVLVFTNKGITDQLPGSTDGNDLATKIDHLTGSFPTITDDAGIHGTEERYDVSVNTFMNLVQASKSIPGKKMMIWLGHGWPMLEDLNAQIEPKAEQHVFDSLVKALNQMREERMTFSVAQLGSPDDSTYRYQVYMKGVKAAKKASFSNLTEQVLAVQSGGRVLGPDNDLPGQLAACISDANTFYTVSFDRPKAAGRDEYHELKIQVGKPGLTARTSIAYYNEP
jgi:VWFA-related protein